jgi:hypothetical protein
MSYFAFFSGMLCEVEYDSNPSIHFMLMDLQREAHMSCIKLTKIISLIGLL